MGTISKDNEVADSMEESVLKPGARRMAGYTPLKTTQNQKQRIATPSASGPAVQAEVRIVDPEPVISGQDQAEPARARTVTHEHPAEVPKPHRRRMGSAAVAPQPQEVKDPVLPNGTGENSPQVSVGQQPQTSAQVASGRRRMGSAPVQPAGPNSSTNAKAQISEDKTESQPVRRNRMGAAPAVQATAKDKDLLSDFAKQSKSSTQQPSAEAKPSRPASDQESPQTSEKAGRKWKRPLAVLVTVVVIAACIVFGARWLRGVQGVQEFLGSYDGHSTHLQDTPEGTPWWMGWQHFFNMFLMVLIVRTGLQVRSERRPPGYWTANKNSFFSPRGNKPAKISITQWLHQFLDVFWVANGVLFIVLLFATGHWKRIVPTNWDIFPNMLSAAIQYASLNWPTENGWIHYNALQLMAYFITVFIAAPLAIISGIRFSTWWPNRFERLSKFYPVEWARAVHIPVLIYFVAFTIVHVFLVFFTGALRNLNHMYASRDTADGWGLVIFLGTLVLVAGGWFLARPLFVTPVASAMGKVSR